MATLQLMDRLRKCGKCGRKLSSKKIMREYNISSNDRDILRALEKGILCPYCGKSIRKLTMTKETAEKHGVKESRNISIC